MLSYPRYPWAHAIKHNMETLQAYQDSSRTGKKYPSFVGCNETEGCSFQVITLRFMKWGDQPTDPKCAHMNALRSVYLKYNKSKMKCLRASVELLEKLLFWQVIMKWDVLWQHHSVGGDETSTDTSCIIGFASFFSTLLIDVISILTTGSPPTTLKKLNAEADSNTHTPLFNLMAQWNLAWYLSEICAFEQTQLIQETHPREKPGKKQGIKKAFSKAE